MSELGEESERGHREVGEARPRLGIDELIAVGETRRDDRRRPREKAGLKKSVAVGSRRGGGRAPGGNCRAGRSCSGQRKPLGAHGARAGRVRETSVTRRDRAMMYYLHRLSERVQRLQRLFLRHVSRGRGGGHRFRALACSSAISSSAN